jgi:hypothetical protein
MAIDVCNKQVLMRVIGDPDVLDGRGDAVGDEDAALDGLLGGNGHAAGATADAHYAAADPAAWASDFGYAVDRVAARLDGRAAAELRRAAREHPDPVMREQALFEYADRNEDDAIELLSAAVGRDPDRQVRWDALWAIEKLGGLRAVRALRRFLGDPDPEIAEWARLFVSELETGDPAFDARGARFTPGRTFDETIFLLIHCDLYIRLDGSNRSWGKLSLAPQGLARVYGQAHACPNVATRDHTLVIAKTIAGLHADGSPHVDNYLFRGFTERVRPDRGNFFFESHVRRPFYLSGRADDRSQGVQDTHIGFMRQGCWYLDPRVQVRGADAIRYVRGRFQGWGYVNLDRVAGRALEEIILPGNAILSTLHDPVAGPLSNVFISGTFKGKLNDWDGDGRIDLNSRDVYSTADGEVDTDMDGIPDRPGAACCSWVSPF